MRMTSCSAGLCDVLSRQREADDQSLRAGVEALATQLDWLTRYQAQHRSAAITTGNVLANSADPLFSSPFESDFSLP